MPEGIGLIVATALTPEDYFVIKGETDMSVNPPPTSYTLGLDIGMASVGWCVLGEDRIIALGARTFDKAEEPDGGSLNATRREKRLMRRRIRRRGHRLLRARRLFRREGLLATSQIEELNHTPTLGSSPWQLRFEGLDRKLSPAEWAIALYHLIKYRGFHSNRKSEMKDDEEAGAMLAGTSGNHTLLDAGGYRTPAELVGNHEKFSSNYRNKAGSYAHTFARADLAFEIDQLFEAQRRFDNPHSTQTFEADVKGLFWGQRPTLTGEAMLKLIGRCTFELDQYRAPKRCYSSERFVWLSKINNLYIIEDGGRRPLNPDERLLLVDLPFSGKTEKITYKFVRDYLCKHSDFSVEARFAGLSYRPDLSGKDPEEALIFSASGWHTIRRAYEKVGLEAEWQQLKEQPARLDSLGYGLTILKTDQEISEHLFENGFSEAEATVVLPLTFKDFINLSLVAIAKLLPGLEAGQRFDEAATGIYGSHSAPLNASRTKLLPSIDREVIRNPVVFRALNQARKVVNALVREFGSPGRVHIEMARDLTRPFDERKKIEKEQHRFRDEKKADIERFDQEFGFAPHAKSQDLLKWRLYREQDGKCPYSLKPLALDGNLTSIFDPSRTQIDHVLPYSRSYDDGVNNKVLVLSTENQNKGNRTPYEYLDGASDSPKWRLFEAWIKANKKLREAKRQRLLRVHFDARASSDFMERNLNDTRYISRFFKNLVEQNLELASTSTAQRCVVVNGQLTAFLRARWGLIKAREGGDLHHALDAAVVAACGHDLVKRLSNYARRGELERVKSGFMDPATGEVVDITLLRQLEDRFPEPFPHFREQLIDRLSVTPSVGKPILVSRAPKRRGSGAAHKETIRSSKRMEADGVSTIKAPLTTLKLADLEKLAGREDPRNHALYEAIRDRLKTFGDGLKAFGPSQPPFRKPSKNGEGPLVRSVRLEETQKSGVLVRGGIADNDTMLRIDVFRKSGKHYLVPVYVADEVKGSLPNLAVVAGKNEKDWVLIEESFDFIFSLYPNDFIRIQLKGKENIEGYYGGFDRSTGAIHVWAHDRNQFIGTKGLIRSIGIKTALSVEKFHVDVLGRLFPALQESRRDVAQHRNS